MPPVDNNWKFSAWMKLVESIIKKETSLGNCGEIDQPFRYWFDEGMSPQEASDIILEELMEKENAVRNLLL